MPTPIFNNTTAPFGTNSIELRLSFGYCNNMHLSPMRRLLDDIGIYKNLNVCDSIVRMSRVKSFFTNGSPNCVMILTTSVACIEPTIPGSDPITPCVAGGIFEASQQSGKRSIYRQFCFASNTDTCPQYSPIAPYTKGFICRAHVSSMRYLVAALSLQSTTKSYLEIR